MRILGTDRQYEAFKAALVRARNEAGLTQVDLAKRLGTTQQFVSKYETGERRLDLVEFVEVMRVLDGDVTRLLREIGREG